MNATETNAEMVEGTLDQILYTNEESGYVVAVVERGDDHGARHRITVVGELGTIEIGAGLRLSGRFENGPLFRGAFLPQQTEQRWRLTVTGSRAEATLVFPQGWPGPACLSWHDATGELHEETWDDWNPWAALVEVFETWDLAGCSELAQLVARGGRELIAGKFLC